MKKTSLGLLTAAVVMAGCSRPAEPPPSPVAKGKPASSAAMPSLTPAAPVADTAGKVDPVPPPRGADTAAADAQAQVKASEDGPLEGKGRPLTPEEVSLLNYGIYMFKEEKGRFPRDLDEAVASRHIRRMPQLPAGEKLQYDPAKGTITVVKGR